MKKFVALLLTCAMVISCVSMVSLFVGAEGENEWSDNLFDEATSTFDTYEAGPAPASIGKVGTPTMTIVVQDEVGPNMVLEFTSPNSFSAPLFPSKTLIRNYANEKGYRNVVAEYTFDILIPEDATIRPMLRAFDAQNGYTGGTKITGTGEWVTGSYTVTASAAQLADDSAWNFTFDSIAPNNTTFRLDNLSLKVKEFTAEVANGNAEDGDKNWSYFTDGSVAIVEGGANDTAHAAYFTAGTNKYGSVAFSVGAAIIHDPDNGYRGAGAATYAVTFYARAEEGKGGGFIVYFNSQWHKNKGTEIGDYTLTENTYNTQAGKTIQMTDEWQKYELQITVTESFHENLVNAFAAGAPANVYDLILRLDGSSGAFASETFNYYLDEVTIEKYVEPTEEPGGTETPKLPGGVRFTVVEDADQLVLKSSAGLLSVAHVKNGQVTVSFPITNESEDADLGIQFALQTVAKSPSTGSNTWAGPDNAYDKVTIAPGETAIVEYTLDVENGKVEVYDEMYDLSTFFLRFDVLQDGSKAVEGGVLKFVIGANADTFYDYVLGMKNIFNQGATTTAETVLTPNGVVYNPNAASADGDALSVALIVLLAVAVVALAIVIIRKKED